MKPKAIKENIVVQDTANETLVYDLRTNKALVLNETSAFIWNLCDGNHDISQIQKQMSKHFNQSATEDFIWFAIDAAPFRSTESLANLLQKNTRKKPCNRLSKKRIPKDRFTL